MRFSYSSDKRERSQTEFKMGRLLAKLHHHHHHEKDPSPAPSNRISQPSPAPSDRKSLRSAQASPAPSNRKPQQSQQAALTKTQSGFLEVKLGDAFCDGRFVVKQQLGTGRYSDVWLVDDHKLNRVAALKILGSEFYHGVPLFELEVMRRIRDVSKTSSHPGRHHIMEFIDDFEIDSPSGKHVCMVFGCLGPTLQEQMAKADQKRLSCKVAKQISRQLLEAMDFLHNECGVLHTDLNTSNILIDEPIRVSELESQAGPAAVLNERLRIRLSDFGLACWQDKHLTDRIQPLVLRAPEITVGGPWEASVDVYSVGCLVHYFVVGEPPFDEARHAPGEDGVEQRRLSLQAAYFGPVPKVVVDNATRADVFFDEKGQIHAEIQLQPRSFEKAIDIKVQENPVLKNDMVSDEIPTFCDFLHASLATDPRRRKRPRDLVNHPWLQHSHHKKPMTAKPVAAVA